MNNEKLFKLITKLNNLTKKKEIAWEEEGPPINITEGTGSIIWKYYFTKYNGQSIAIYELREKEYDGMTDTSYWSKKYVFSLIDNRGYETWSTISQSAILFDLFETVEYQVAGVSAIIEDLLDAE